MSIYTSFRNHFIPICIIMIVGFPFSLFLIKVSEISFPDYSSLFHIFSITFIQAFLSTLLSMLIALPATLGLLRFSEYRFYKILEWIYLLPILLPAIVIAGGVMNLTESMISFPFGLLPLILCHALSYSGAIAVVISQSIMYKSYSLCEWARVQGASSFKLFINLIRYSIRRDVLLVLFTVFCFCFTSFSLPLLVGGSYWQTIEVHIYGYLKDLTSWPLALGLLLLEISFIFLLSFFIFKPLSYIQTKKPIPYLGSKFCLIFGLLPIFLITAGLSEGFFYLDDVLRFEGIGPIIASSITTSVFVGIGVIISLSLISLFPSSNYLKRFLIGYGTPSLVLTGFAFLVFFLEYTYFSWISGLIILFLPALYRWAAAAFLNGLENQILVAKTLGSSLTSIFFKIILPQTCSKLFLLGGVASIWAIGDFSFTMITAGSKINLSILAQQLLNQYRWEEGLAIILLFLMIGSMIFFIFQGMSISLNLFLKKFYQ